MKFRNLQTRFLMAGCLLVLTTLACGLWSVILFARLSSVVGNTIRESQGTIDLSAILADSLEREDDALLRALNGEIRNARSEVTQQRQDFDDAYRRMSTGLRDADEHEAALALREHADSYRAIGDVLLAAANEPGARDVYQRQVNPALRKAVADCSRIRELNFRSMQQVGVQARNETRKATGIVAGIALVAVGLSTLVMVRLAHVVLRPIRDLTQAVEAVRRDDFTCRVRVDSADELGQLAQGFNLMTETLAEYHASSLGELLQAKSTLEATLAALPDAVIVVDPDGQIVSRNALAEKILTAIGIKESARVADLPLPPSILRDVDETLRNGHSNGTRANLNQALPVTLNGRELKMIVSVSPIPEFAPRRAGAAIVLADVTEFARLDELRTEVVAVASHELKTPLTSLQMNLLLLQEHASSLTALQREILDAAVHGSKELGATIEELLDLTRIEAGQFQLVRQRVDLAAVIEQVVRTLRPRYEDANVGLRIVKDVQWAIVEGDAARLKIVFVNLLTNALKYTPHSGEVTVRLTSGQNAGVGGKPRLRIAVTDTGPGIPPDLRERVFEKFFRVEDQSPNGHKGVRGTGIGLYLCHEIVQAHGGAIVCAAGENELGTQFAIELDCEQI